MYYEHENKDVLKLVLKQQVAELHFGERAADAVTLCNCISYFQTLYYFLPVPCINSSSSYSLCEIVTSE